MKSWNEIRKAATNEVVVAAFIPDSPISAFVHQFFCIGTKADSDGDGLSDADKDWIYGSDPFLADSDWDGSPDGAEVANGTDPLDRLSLIVDVTLTVTNCPVL